MPCSWKKIGGGFEIFVYLYDALFYTCVEANLMDMYILCVAAPDWEVMVCSDRDLPGIHSVQGWLQSTLCGTLHASAFSQVLPLARRGEGWFCKFFPVESEIFCESDFDDDNGLMWSHTQLITNMHVHTYTDTVIRTHTNKEVEERERVAHVDPSQWSR